VTSLHCPHCDASMPAQRSWAQVAVSTLIAAPAVPDMATQVRCSKCGRLSAASDLRYAVADRFRPLRLLLGVAAGGVFAWVVLRFVG